jgi:hypothetical protein
MGDEISFTMIRYMNPIDYPSGTQPPAVKTGVKQYEQNMVYSVQIANISTILLIEFIYLTIVNEISSSIKYADDVIQ